jgi:hypothetical protein
MTSMSSDLACVAGRLVGACDATATWSDVPALGDSVAEALLLGSGSGYSQATIEL